MAIFDVRLDFSLGAHITRCDTQPTLSDAFPINAQALKFFCAGLGDKKGTVYFILLLLGPFPGVPSFGPARRSTASVRLEFLDGHGRNEKQAD